MKVFKEATKALGIEFETRKDFPFLWSEFISAVVMSFPAVIRDDLSALMYQIPPIAYVKLKNAPVVWVKTDNPEDEVLLATKICAEREGDYILSYAVFTKNGFFKLVDQGGNPIVMMSATYLAPFIASFGLKECTDPLPSTFVGMVMNKAKALLLSDDLVFNMLGYAIDKVRKKGLNYRDGTAYVLNLYASVLGLHNMTVKTYISRPLKKVEAVVLVID